MLEKKLTAVEERTQKKQLKWKKISRKIKQTYLEELLKIKELKNACYYAKYEASKEYSKLTSLTIAKAVLTKESENYTVTIIIDGLNIKERDVVRKELKKLKIKYRKIRGMKDEQSVLLRLSDALAGFLREVIEGEKYAKSFMKRFQSTKMIIEA